MTDNNQPADLPDDIATLEQVPQSTKPTVKKSAMRKVKPKTSREQGFNHAWWLPLLALLITTYFIVGHYTSKGTLITISFKSAEGLEVKKTKIKYKDVVIGRVEAIELKETLDGVKVRARMDRSSEELLRKDTRFWIVKPRLSATQITGLNTIISGSYITLDPTKDPTSDYHYEFIGLERPPVISQEEAGLKIKLSSTKASLLAPGTSVYYKGFNVGRVDSVDLSEDNLSVKANVFIKSPHHKLIKPTTKFWSASGVTFGAGAEGVEVSIESIEALLGGGIAFETEPSLLNRDDVVVPEDTEFTLFDNKKRAEEQETGRAFYFVTYFDGSIKGLKVGAPVTVQGMKIGSVKEVSLQFDEALINSRVSVLFEIYESRFRRISTQGENNRTASPRELENFTDKLLQKGLSAQLETGSLLTGSKEIALIFDKRNRHTSARKIDPLTQFTVVPSAPDSFAAITEGAAEFVQKINALPLEQVGDNVNQLLTSANQQVKQLPLAAIGNNLNAVLGTAKDKLDKADIDQLIKRLNSLIANIDKQIARLPLDKTLKNINGVLKESKGVVRAAKSTLQTAQKAVKRLSAAYSADAPLYYNANLSMEQLNTTLVSLQAILDLLERNPNSLIFGKGEAQPPAQSYWGSE
ncbi:MAG: hypothetical protein CR974_02745 [Gammaproteobacteria bacterium]|nr:MAG: hypothetical protein CR974_02745 [Gammaproteobacteria bacterium]